MNIKSLKLQKHHYGDQWFDAIEDRWNYDDFKADKQWKEGWISFDSLLYHQDTDRVFLGITSFASDIFKAYDRKTGEFVDMGFGKIADPFDAKFHRSLVEHTDGNIYAAIALLHDIDNYFNAPGGSIVRYNPKTGDIQKIVTPQKHVYIQSLALDKKRELLYCQCFAPEKLLIYNIKTGDVKDLGLLASGLMGMAQGENIVLDDNDCLWFNWQVTRAWQSESGVDMNRLAKYDPDADKVTYFKHGLPKPDGSYGTVKVEAYFNFGDGFIYASGANGSLYRIDPSGEVEYLFTPVKDRPSRLASMVKVEEGVAYAITGRNGDCELLRVRYKEGKYERLGKIVDADGEALYQCHDIVYAGDGTLYVGENDNPYRSSYLWEIKL